LWVALEVPGFAGAGLLNLLFVGVGGGGGSVLGR
jgi:hypothetical protein